MFPSYSSRYDELDALADDLEYRAALARQQAALQRSQSPRVRRAPQPRPVVRHALASAQRYMPLHDMGPLEPPRGVYEYSYIPSPARHPANPVTPAYESGYRSSRAAPAPVYEVEDARGIPAYNQNPYYAQFFPDEGFDDADEVDSLPPLAPLTRRTAAPHRQPAPRSPASPYFYDDEDCDVDGPPPLVPLTRRAVGPRQPALRSPAPVIRPCQPAPRRVSFEPSYEEDEERAPSRVPQDTASPSNSTVQDIASILGQLLGGAQQPQRPAESERLTAPAPAQSQPSIADILGQVLGSVVQQPQQQPQRQVWGSEASQLQLAQAQALQRVAQAQAQAQREQAQAQQPQPVRRAPAPAPPRPAAETEQNVIADILSQFLGQSQPQPQPQSTRAPAQQQQPQQPERRPEPTPTPAQPSIADVLGQVLGSVVQQVQQPERQPAPAPRQAPSTESDEAQAPSLQDFLANIINLATQHAQQPQTQTQTQTQPQPQAQAQQLPPSLMRSAQPPTQSRKQQVSSSTPAPAPGPVEPKPSYTYAAPASAQPAAIPHPHPHAASASPALPIPGRAYQHIPHNPRDVQPQAQRKAGVADEVADIKEAIRRSLADRAGVEAHSAQAPSAASPTTNNANATSTATAATSSAKQSSIEAAVSSPTEPVPGSDDSESPSTAAAAQHLAEIAKIEERFVNLSYDFNFPAAPDFSPSSSSPSSPITPSLAYTHTNQPIRAYELALTGLLTDLDAVESAGDEEVRHARKELVGRIEGALEALERQKEEAWKRVSASSSPVSTSAPPAPEAEVARSKEVGSEDVVVEQPEAASDSSDEGYVIPSAPAPEPEAPVAVQEDSTATAPVADAATDVESAKVVSDTELDLNSPAPLLQHNFDSEGVMVTPDTQTQQAEDLPASQLQSVESASESSPAVTALDENIPSGTPSVAHEDVDAPSIAVMTPAPSRSLAEIDDDQPAAPVSYAAVVVGASPSTADSASSASYPPVPPPTATPSSAPESANPAKAKDSSFRDESGAVNEESTPVNDSNEEDEPEHVNAFDSLGSSPVDIPSELDSDFDEETPRPVADNGNGAQKEKKEAEVIPPSMEEAAEVESKTEFVML